MDEPTTGTRIEQCRSCQAPIWWGRTRNNKPCPYDVIDGQPTLESHFGSCPHSKTWSKKGKP
jgi:hypothetical protein